MAPPTEAKRAGALATAIVAASNVPLLLLDADLRVAAASSSFCDTFGVTLASAHGRRLVDVGAGEWNVPQLSTLLQATASGLANVEAYEMDLRRSQQPVRHLVINVRKLDYGDPTSARLLVAIADVTAARIADELKDRMVREKANLLTELQHRIANSLQIIASVLMQSARQVNSNESRGHLFDAHHRIMSVAAMERQLAVSPVSDVSLRPYFTALCQSISASMIRDPDQLSITVAVDDSVGRPEVTTCLGLIVTELIINALKHAFPDFRHGRIVVDYRTVGSGWTLTVSDDGVGIPPEADLKPGLGTSIVAALAAQLDARVRTGSGMPGTVVSIERD